MKYLLAPLALLATSAMAQPQQPDMVNMFLQQFDADKNGSVNEEEFLKPTRMQFQYMDKNGDGSLDRGEVEAFNKEAMERARQMQQQMQQRGGQYPQR